jgi:hypothetical protein
MVRVGARGGATRTSRENLVDDAAGAEAARERMLRMAPSRLRASWKRSSGFFAMSLCTNASISLRLPVSMKSFIV